MQDTYIGQRATLIDHLLSLLYPSRCILCRRFLSEPGRPRICPDCAAAMAVPPLGTEKRVDFLSQCVSAAYYTGNLASAIRRFKFLGMEVYSDAFGVMVADCIQHRVTESYDLVSWVPLASDRRRKRGYDQAELIARSAAKRLGCEVVPLLKKRRGVSPQSKTRGEAARRANISGAYSLRKGVDVDGRQVLLIDDVITTGSTMSECAKCLLLAGADKVIGVSVAEG